MKSKHLLTAAAACMAFPFVPCFAQQSESERPDKIHLTGEKARTLISILDNGGAGAPRWRRLSPSRTLPRLLPFATCTSFEPQLTNTIRTSGFTS